MFCICSFPARTSDAILNRRTKGFLKLTTHRRIIKVFLASPGDLKEERNAAVEIVNDINQDSADFWQIHLQLVGWEYTVSKFGRSQELINRELDECEYVIGMMWQKWGSPTKDADAQYTSGFEEEFRRSVDKRERTGSPEISMLFKTPEQGRLDDRGPELTKVLTFRKELVDKKTVHFQEFEDLASFKKRLRTLLTSYVQCQLQEQNQSEVTSISGLGIGTEQKLPAKSSSPSNSHLISDLGIKFLNELIQRPNASETVDSTAIARFRLLAVSVSRAGNDEILLGAHDANILFQHRQELKLGETEIKGLIRAGLGAQPNENLPLWYWLAADSDTKPHHNLIWNSVMGAENQRMGSIKCLTLCGYPLNSDDAFLDRTFILNSWLLEDNSRAMKECAVAYLSKLGVPEDIPALEEALQKDASLARKIENAIILIAGRSSREFGFKKLGEIEPDAIEDQTIDLLFLPEQAVKTETLQSCLSNRAASVRFKAAQILSERERMTIEQTKLLLEDTDAGTRFFALQRLINSGLQFSTEEVEHALVKTKPALGLSGLFSNNHNKEGTEYFEKFKLARLRKLAEHKILEIMDDASIYDQLPQIALYDSFFKKYKQDIILNLSDGFGSYYDQKLDSFAAKYATEAKLIDDTRSLLDYLKSQLTSAALGALCKYGGKDDLAAVRQTIDEGFTGFSPIAVNFLKKYGSWDDIGRISKIAEKPLSRKSTLLYIDTDQSHYALAAQAIVSLGTKQMADLLALGLSNGLLIQVLLVLPQKSFALLDDEVLLTLFHSKNDRCRQVAALKTNLSVSKKRIATLLNKYVNTNEYRYYNVIHWLDFGTSMPTKLVRTAASELLSAI